MGWDFVPRSPLNKDACKRHQRSIFIPGEPDDVLLFVSGFSSGAYSERLLNGTRQRLSGFSQPRQCGEDVFRILVTGGPPVRSGGGMPQRIIVISVPSGVLRMTGAR